MRMRHCRTHLFAWCALGLLLPAIMLGALTLRLSAPAADAPVRLAAP